MKAKGIRQERETIINYNEAEDTAYVYTASQKVYRALMKKGYATTERTCHPLLAIESRYPRSHRGTESTEILLSEEILCGRCASVAT